MAYLILWCYCSLVDGTAYGYIELLWHKFTQKMHNDTVGMCVVVVVFKKILLWRLIMKYTWIK